MRNGLSKEKKNLIEEIGAKKFLKKIWLKEI